MHRKNVTVYFLGEKYTFSKDIITYKNELADFGEMNQELATSMFETCTNIDRIPSNVSKIMFLEFLSIGYSFVLKLHDYDIYDVSVDDVIGIRPEIFNPETCYDAAVNEGVKLFYKGLMDLEIEKNEALNEQEEKYVIQSHDAEMERDSKVKGTGFGVVTNNMINFAIWAAMEDQTREEQFADADADYHDELDLISGSLETETQNRLHEYEKNVWSPHLLKSATLIINSLFDKYIDILIEHGKLESETLFFTNYNMSQSILEMIDDSEYRPKILKAAMLSCPYNPNVYKLAIDSSNVEEIAKCAKTFKVAEGIVCDYQTECRTLALDDTLSEKELKEKTSLYLKAISLMNGNLTDEDVINIHRNIIQDKISQYADFSDDKFNLKIKEYIRTLHLLSNIAKNEISEEELRQYIKQKLLIDIFSENGQADWVIYKDSILHTVERISRDVKNYWIRIICAIFDYLSKKKEYEDYDAFATCNTNQIQNELNELSVFSFVRKKTLKRKMVQLQSNIDACKKNYIEAEKVYKILLP